MVPFPPSRRRLQTGTSRQHIADGPAVQKAVIGYGADFLTQLRPVGGAGSHNGGFITTCICTLLAPRWPFTRRAWAVRVGQLAMCLLRVATPAPTALDVRSVSCPVPAHDHDPRRDPPAAMNAPAHTGARFVVRHASTVG